MKLIIWFMAILVCGYSCSKSSTQSYYGKWKLVKIHSAIGPGVGDFIPSQDSVMTLDLNSNGEYNFSLNAEQQSSGKFNIKKVDSYDQLNKTQSVPVEQALPPETISFKNDTLLINSPLFPGGHSASYYIHN